MSEAASVDTTYRRFAEDPSYVQANAAYVERLPVEGVRRILDLCGGSGAVGSLLMAKASGATLQAVDLDPVQIGLAAETYAVRGYRVLTTADGRWQGPEGGREVRLTVGSATELGAFPEAAFDCANIANAIHLIPDKEGLIGGIARVLEPDGLFAFSSGFYAGCWPPVTQQVYYEWLKEATTWIASLSAERVARGEPPIRRQRGKSQLSAVAYQNRWLTPDEWRALLDRLGFDVIAMQERAVMFDHHSLASVGAYSGLAEAQLSGYPTEIASQALEHTAGLALASANVSAVQHNWIEVCARRRGA